MTRILSEQDYQEISKFEISANDAGWDFATEAGGLKNAATVLEYLDKNPTVLCTHAELIRFLNSHASLFVARSPMQRKYDAIVKTVGRTQAELDAFHKLMTAVAAKQRVDVAGDNYWYNSALILAQLQGRAIDYQNFLAAVGRLAPSAQGSKFSSTEKLIFVTEQYVGIDPRKGVHQSDPNHKTGKFIEGANQTDTQRFFSKPEAPQENKVTTREEDYYRKANDGLVRSGSHGQQQALSDVRTAELARHGSEKQAHATLQQAYRGIFKQPPTSLTPFEEIAKAGRR